MSTLIDLTVGQYPGNGTLPIHGPTPLMFRGPASHGLTAQRGIHNPYDNSLVSAANEYILITGHTGTHVDSPHHVDNESSITVEHLPLERTHGPAIWLDVSSWSEPNAEIGPDELAQAEHASGEKIQPRDILLLHTGWSEATRREGENESTHPYLIKEAAEWLRARAITAIGVDMASPEGSCAVDLPVHMNFLRPRSLGLSNSDYILIYENLRHVSSIGPHRFIFSGLPIPFYGSTGSPVRAVAIV